MICEYPELTKECEKLKAEDGGGGGVAWEEELQVVRSERDQAVQQVKTLRQTVTGLQREKQVSRTLSPLQYLIMWWVFIASCFSNVI